MSSSASDRSNMLGMLMEDMMDSGGLSLEHGTLFGIQLLTLVREFL